MFIVTIAAASPLGAQVPDLSDVTIVTTAINERVYMLEATGDVAGNIAVSVGEDGILIVDDQFAGLTGRILDALSELHSGSLRFILNTHHHAAHDQVRARLLQKQAAHWPTVSYAEGLTIHCNGEAIQAEGFPVQYEEWNHGYSSASDWIELIYRSLD